MAGNRIDLIETCSADPATGELAALGAAAQAATIDDRGRSWSVGRRDPNRLVAEMAGRR